MESSLDWDKKNLINELSRGRELARQLQIHLNVPSSSHEARELLVRKILNSFDKALTMLGGNGPLATAEPQPSVGQIIVLSDSPGSFSGSPKSEESDRDLKDNEIKTEPKKRKSMPRWAQEVQICPGTGLEGPLEDGYSWRKYGQKDILGAKYPRGYFRCAHRQAQGCLATKQVQRSDEDPNVFEITYRGRHTCTNQLPSPEKKLKPNTMSNCQQQMTQPQHYQYQNQNQSQEILQSFETGQKVETEGLQTQNHNFPTDNNFHFPSTLHIEGEKNIVSPPMMENTFSGNCFSPPIISPATSMSDLCASPPMMENTFSGNYFSPPIISPATSMSDLCAMSPSTGLGEARNMHGSDSELIDIVSAATSGNNSPTVGLNFPFEPMDPFELSFSFDNPSFFSNF